MPGVHPCQYLQVWRGPLIAAGGFKRESGMHAVQSGEASAPHALRACKLGPQAMVRKCVPQVAAHAGLQYICAQGVPRFHACAQAMLTWWPAAGWSSPTASLHACSRMCLSFCFLAGHADLVAFGRLSSSLLYMRFLGLTCFSSTGCAGHADLVAYGRLFIANPDLPLRFCLDAPLSPCECLGFCFRRALDYHASAQSRRDESAVSSSAVPAKLLPGRAALNAACLLLLWPGCLHCCHYRLPACPPSAATDHRDTFYTFDDVGVSATGWPSCIRVVCHAGSEAFLYTCLA